MDDVLCDRVGGRSLGTKDAYQRYGGQMACLDLVILVDEIEQIELLTLVLMSPLTRWSGRFDVSSATVLTIPLDLLPLSGID